MHEYSCQTRKEKEKNIHDHIKGMSWKLQIITGKLANKILLLGPKSLD